MPESKRVESLGSESRGKVIYDRPAGVKQFSEITFASFAILKYGMKPRAAVPDSGPNESWVQTIFPDLCVGFLWRGLVSSWRLAESSYGKTIFSGEPRTNIPSDMPISELNNWESSRVQNSEKLEYMKFRVHSSHVDY